MHFGLAKSSEICKNMSCVPRSILNIELRNFNSVNLLVFSKGTKEKNTSYDELSLISEGYRRQEEKVHPATAQKRNLGKCPK